jgi:hypothetical protein
MPFFTPYGVPPAVMSLSAVNTPADVIEAIVVPPYLNTRLPPDSTIEKLVVETDAEAGTVGNVQLAKLPEAGVPKAGVTNVGLFAKTKAPEPVSSETAAAKLDEDGVAKKVATPVPKPEIPVATGRPVAFVSVIEAGVPYAFAPLNVFTPVIV